MIIYIFTVLELCFYGCICITLNMRYNIRYSIQTVYNTRYSKIRNACTCKCFNNCVSFSKINYNVKQQPDLHIARS